MTSIGPLVSYLRRAARKDGLSANVADNATDFASKFTELGIGLPTVSVESSTEALLQWINGVHNMTANVHSDGTVELAYNNTDTLDEWSESTTSSADLSTDAETYLLLVG